MGPFAPGPSSARAPRYAIYYAPEPDGALSRFGAAWLGRDAERDIAMEQPRLRAVPPSRLAEMTAEPRRYGFHATLKAPFRLAPGHSEKMLLDAVARFASTLPSARIPALRLAAIDGFLALVPAKPVPAVDALAAACVGRFAPLSAALDEIELARRLRAPLTPRQKALLLDWGYPYVFSEYRFHMTLTRRLTEAEREAVEPELLALAAPALAIPVRIAGLAVFIEEARSAPLRLLARCPMMPSSN